MDQHGTFYWITHGVSLTALVGALWGALPVLGAMVAIVWYVIQIKESETYKKWWLNRHKKRVAKAEAKLAYLKSLERYENA